MTSKPGWLDKLKTILTKDVTAPAVEKASVEAPKENGRERAVQAILQMNNYQQMVAGLEGRIRSLDYRMERAREAGQYGECEELVKERKELEKAMTRAQDGLVVATATVEAIKARNKQYAEADQEAMKIQVEEFIRANS